LVLLENEWLVPVLVGLSGPWKVLLSRPPARATKSDREMRIRDGRRMSDVH